MLEETAHSEQDRNFRAHTEPVVKTGRTRTGIEITALDGGRVGEKTASTADLRLVTSEPVVAAQVGEKAQPQAVKPEAAKAPGRTNVVELFARQGAAPDARVSKAVNSARASQKEPGATGKPDAVKAVAAPKAPTGRRAA